MLIMWLKVVCAVLLSVLASCVFCAESIEDEVRNSTRFSLEFYQKYFNGSSNAIISPLSIRIELALMYQSVWDYSQSDYELRHVLHFANTKLETRQSQLQYLNAIAADSSLSVFNKIYLKQDHRLLPGFTETVNLYKSSVEQVDFANSNETTWKINNWAMKETKGLIHDLVSQDSITNDLALLIVSTLHFKAKWQIPFEMELVNGTFYNGEKNCVIPYMKNEDAEIGYTYSEALQSQVLQLHYNEESNYSFWIILPDDSSNITQVGNLLSIEHLDKIRKDLVEGQYELFMPAFEIENEIDGNKYLRALGLNSIFDLAEFQLIDGPFLSINEIKQKVKIVVDTEGTEAAAATTIRFPFRSAFQSEIVVNRPFIYIIFKDNEIAFLGHFVKP